MIATILKSKIAVKTSIAIMDAFVNMGKYISDRYFILDKNKVYHCGASINRIGYKTFSITLISDDIVNQKLLENVDKKNLVK